MGKRKPCKNCEKAQGVRPGGLCNKCFALKTEGKLNVESIRVDSIEVDQNFQLREGGVDTGVVEDYAEALQNGATLPPVTVYRLTDQDNRLVLVSGFHRLEAHKAAELDEIPCVIHEGDRLDALSEALGANAEHGLQRTNADKRKAVTTALEQPEWAEWSNMEVARRCKVSHMTVKRVREDLTLTKLKSDPESDEPEERTYTTRHGTTATMNVKNIGKKKGAADDDGSASETSTEAVESEALESEADEAEEQEAEPESAKNDGVLRDGLGVPVREEHLEVFTTGIAQFKELKRLHRVLSQLVHETATGPCGKHYRTCIQCSTVGGKTRYKSLDLDAFRRGFKFRVPYSLCPWCYSQWQGEQWNPTCNACKGEGWVSKESFEQAEDIDQQAVLDLAREEGLTCS